MDILLIGSGGREHALAWKLNQSPRCGHLMIAPGNAGTASLGENIPVAAEDLDGLLKLLHTRKVDMVVVGPEAPLVAGLVDRIKEDPALADLPVVGPDAAGSRLEGSKAFAKEFMRRHEIPTAGYRDFRLGEIEAGLAYLAAHPLPLVLKADGLAAGKGVVICETHEQAVVEFREMLEQAKFGEASARVVVEQFLSGIELSVFALCDGTDYILLPTSKDYKRIGEGDSGPNTGGMGAVSPVPFADEPLMAHIEDEIVRPTVRGLNAEGIVYRGFIYFGLMITADGPYVIEYNCRMGDPETQAVMPMLDADLLELFEAAATGGLDSAKAGVLPGCAAAVVMAAEGYPGAVRKGMVIRGLKSYTTNTATAQRVNSREGASESPRTLLFQAGTSLDTSGNTLTAGGRVLAVVGRGTDLESALENAYDALKDLGFEGCYYRSDIGFDLLRSKESGAG